MHSLYIFGAQYLVFIMAVVAAIYWLFLPKQQKLFMVFYGLILVIIAFTLAKIGSSLFDNPRPFAVDHVAPLITHAADNGFPSEHTLLAASIAAIVLAVSKKWGAILLVAALAVGLSRIAVHVHHTIDILGSLGFVLIGAIAAWYGTPQIIRYLAMRHQYGDKG